MSVIEQRNLDLKKSSSTPVDEIHTRNDTITGNTAAGFNTLNTDAQANHQQFNYSVQSPQKPNHRKKNSIGGSFMVKMPPRPPMSNSKDVKLPFEIQISQQLTQSSNKERSLSDKKSVQDDEQVSNFITYDQQHVRNKKMQRFKNIMHIRNTISHSENARNQQHQQQPSLIDQSLINNDLISTPKYINLSQKSVLPNLTVVDKSQQNQKQSQPTQLNQSAHNFQPIQVNIRKQLKLNMQHRAQHSFNQSSKDSFHIKDSHILNLDMTNRANDSQHINQLHQQQLSQNINSSVNLPLNNHQRTNNQHSGTVTTLQTNKFTKIYTKKLGANKQKKKQVTNLKNNITNITQIRGPSPDLRTRPSTLFKPIVSKPQHMKQASQEFKPQKEFMSKGEYFLLQGINHDNSMSDQKSSGPRVKFLEQRGSEKSFMRSEIMGTPQVEEIQEIQISPVSKRDFYNGLQVNAFSIKHQKDSGLGLSSILNHDYSNKNSYCNSSNKKDSINVRLKPLSNSKVGDAYSNYFLKHQGSSPKLQIQLSDDKKSLIGAGLRSSSNGQDLVNKKIRLYQNSFTSNNRKLSQDNTGHKQVPNQSPYRTYERPAKILSSTTLLDNTNYGENIAKGVIKFKIKKNSDKLLQKEANDTNQRLEKVLNKILANKMKNAKKTILI
ncbi:UNKNOWN [Stylonychia lemnae]|uniref:Uncharacterized protein n=1 Tax=Stylonychia lemnae TaxID=5949 RepID=A0A078AZ14_STYLE|nr:UNKNOWN [Stylonychia lemnae]|eukprot:CDW87690.1 UNKNOWN [Stylonychia lemnae]